MEGEKIICMTDVVDALNKKGYNAEHEHAWIHIKTDSPVKMCKYMLRSIPDPWSVAICRDGSGCNVFLPVVPPVEKDAENANILYQWAISVDNMETVLSK